MQGPGGAESNGQLPVQGFGVPTYARGSGGAHLNGQFIASGLQCSTHRRDGRGEPNETASSRHKVFSAAIKEARSGWSQIKWPVIDTEFKRSPQKQRPRGRQLK